MLVVSLLVCRLLRTELYSWFPFFFTKTTATCIRQYWIVSCTWKLYESIGVVRCFLQSARKQKKRLSSFKKSFIVCFLLGISTGNTVTVVHKCFLVTRLLKPCVGFEMHVSCRVCPRFLHVHHGDHVHIVIINRSVVWSAVGKQEKRAIFVRLLLVCHSFFLLLCIFGWYSTGITVDSLNKRFWSQDFWYSAVN